MFIPVWGQSRAISGELWRWSSVGMEPLTNGDFKGLVCYGKRAGIRVSESDCGLKQRRDELQRYQLNEVPPRGKRALGMVGTEGVSGGDS